MWAVPVSGGPEGWWGWCCGSPSKGVMSPDLAALAERVVDAMQGDAVLRIGRLCQEAKEIAQQVHGGTGTRRCPRVSTPHCLHFPMP